tara:strand:- start:698 stop:1129 length:432 start_codon:yes stop_codon:yes gene_type:complete
MIEDIFLTPNNIIKNPLGDIFHVMKSSSKGFFGFGEVYISAINKNKIKGWKRHNQIYINLTVITGCAKFVVYDERENSCSKGEINSYLLGPTVDYSRLSIPPGLWVAFKGIEEENLILNVIPKEHDPNEADNKPLNFLKFPEE